MRHAQSDSFDKSFDYRSVKENWIIWKEGAGVIYHMLCTNVPNPVLAQKEYGDTMDNNYVWQEIRIQSSNQITTKDLEVHVDVDFAGNFDKDYTQNGDRARSRHG